MDGGAQSKRSGGGAVIDVEPPDHADAAHLVALLNALTRAPAQARYYLDLVRPLRDYDSAHSSELVKTLRLFLQHNGNVLRTSRALYVHRSTLMGRLNHIEGLTELDLEEPYTRMALLVGCLLLDRKAE
jgi:DNA-binding PucR family transcriptional regulator